MFNLGLEFNLDKLKKVWKSSILNSVLSLGLISAIFIGVGTLFSSSTSEALVLSASVSLSSTTVFLKCLKPEESDSLAGRSILGILIVQDILLGGYLAS